MVFAENPKSPMSNVLSAPYQRKVLTFKLLWRVYTTMLPVIGSSKEWSKVLIPGLVLGLSWMTSFVCMIVMQQALRVIV